MPKLLAFYRKVRPGGFWGPVAAQAPEVPPSRDTAWNLVDWACGCVMIYGALFGVGKIILKEAALGSLFLAIAVVAGGFIYWDLSRRGWSSVMD